MFVNRAFSLSGWDLIRKVYMAGDLFLPTFDHHKHFIGHVMLISKRSCILKSKNKNAIEKCRDLRMISGEKFIILKKQHWGKVPPNFVKYSPLGPLSLPFWQHVYINKH